MLELLLFCDFVDRSAQTFRLRVLFGPRPPIRPCKLAEPRILPRQLPLQVRHRRLKPDDLDMRVLRNEFPDLPPELSESRWIAYWIPLSVVTPWTAARDSWKCTSEAGERTPQGFVGSCKLSANSSLADTRVPLAISIVRPSKTRSTLETVLSPVPRCSDILWGARGLAHS
jgi:hypothetical protein